MERPSQYLKNRAEALKNSLEFFSNPGYQTPKEERSLIFLSQIDFWDFEIESLIYIFQDFHKRQLSWKGLFTDKIRELGFMVNPKYSDKATESFRIKTNDQAMYKIYNPDKVVEVVMPLEDLNEVILLWNKLIKLCSELLIPNSQLDSSGISYKNIKDFKKNLMETT